MTQALAKRKKMATAIAEPVTEAVATLSMLSRIISDPTISIERVEQAFAFHERVQASQARKAFDAAMAAAKAAIPVIKKNCNVTFGEGTKTTAYDHEDLAEIARTVDPILSANGLSYRFRVSSAVDAPVTVTCVISHVDGHFEVTTLASGRDTSGAKNAIQSVGSTLTYLQRYTLKAALGLASAKDDDGKTSEATADELATLSDKQIAEFEQLLKDTNSNRAVFLKIAQAESVSDILAKDFEGLKKVFAAKKGNPAP